MDVVVFEKKRNSVISYDRRRKLWLASIFTKSTPTIELGGFDTIDNARLAIKHRLKKGEDLDLNLLMEIDRFFQSYQPQFSK